MNVGNHTQGKGGNNACVFARTFRQPAFDKLMCGRVKKRSTRFLQAECALLAKYDEKSHGQWEPTELRWFSIARFLSLTCFSNYVFAPLAHRAAIRF